MDNISPNFYHLSSSLRVALPIDTLKRVEGFAQALGISRVTDITWLDCVGVPVFSSIRPTAQKGSLCVNAGKGLKAIEAKVGAYMEAVEFALAEYGCSKLKSLLATPLQVLDTQTRPQAILDFCPDIGKKIYYNEPIECVEAEEIISKTTFLIPAELVFFPYKHILGGKSYFRQSTNGLCSGNTVLEATIHGILELIERDIASFQHFRDTSILVNPETFPPSVKEIYQRTQQVGINLYVRYVKNDFGLPFFKVTVAESNTFDPYLFIFGGYGCHPLTEVALTRAVCEALQSRLSFIHGGRDDLVLHYNRYKNLSFQQLNYYTEKVIMRESRTDKVTSYENIVNIPVFNTLEDCYNLLVSTLTLNKLSRILSVVFTEPNDPIQVVRIIIPALEFFDENQQRIGVRLRDYVRSLA